jgi:hypothetical protein
LAGHDFLGSHHAFGGDSANIRIFPECFPDPSVGGLFLTHTAIAGQNKLLE